MYFTSRVIRRLHEVSGAQLLVLKFDASDISGALADPLPAQDSQKPAGKPQVNPEKLMRALIRKLYSTCHPSQPTAEARVLEWSLHGREEGRRFSSRLAAAYQKSVSKAYKETVSNSFKEALKESQSSAWEFKANLERIFGLLAFAAFLGVAIWVGLGSIASGLTQKYLMSATAGIAAFAALAWTVKRSREVTRDADRQAQFSYEFDYSLAQMESDLKALLNVLRVSAGEPFDRRRCFTRVVMVFDELDKLENPVEQLNNVITHFKNFFTLSDALFVFLTDHQFYEHLCVESVRAQQLRQYSTEHTFFTNRIYLRKPEFEHFYEAVYRSCEEGALIDAAAQADGKAHVADTRLLDHLLEHTSDLLPRLRGACLPALTHLVLNLNRYSQEQQTLIQDMFQTAGGPSDPYSMATLWSGLVGTPREQQYRETFETAGGWNHAESVALLYYHRERFSLADRPVIERQYGQLKSPGLKRYQSVDGAPFTLSDIARALCFQSRNHYFDLFYLIHDYVSTYEGGVPVLQINDPRFGREQRLWSRYQQMVEAAFRYRREDHPRANTGTDS